MVVYLVVPIVPSIPSSSHPLTEIHPDWLSGCIISKNIDKFKRVDVVRLVASLSDGCARLGTVVIGGMGIWGIGFALGGVLGMMGEGVHYSYHKQCPQFSEGVYGPTGPAPDTTISLLRGSDEPQKTAMCIVVISVM